jgi:hypothetical protein
MYKSKNNKMDVFIVLALNKMLNIALFSYEICKMHVIPSLVRTSTNKSVRR